MLKHLTTLLRDDSAQGMTEYAIIVGTIVFAVIVTFMAMGTRLLAILTDFNTDLSQVPTS